MDLVRILIVPAMLAIAALSASPATAKNGRNAAFVGGAAAGVVGGVLLNQALQGGAVAAPAPEPVYIQSQPVRVDPDYVRMSRLRDSCDAGSRRACVQFGIQIGQKRERQAQLRRMHPDLFEWENY